MRVARARRTGALLLGAAVFAAGLGGCAASDPAPTPSASPGADWVPFGVFSKPAEFVEEPALPGPADIEVPEVGIVHLDAADFLPDEEISAQVFTTTTNESVPMIVGVVRSWTPGGGRELPGHATTVLGIDVTSGEAVLRSKVRAYLGKPHTSELAGRSDLGVVAVAVEGAIDEGDPRVIRRTVGIDAARGTHVWSLDGGYPGYGEDTARLLHASSRDACAERVERYHVGSGRIVAVDEVPEGEAGGAVCQRAGGAALLLE